MGAVDILQDIFVLDDTAENGDVVKVSTLILGEGVVKALEVSNWLGEENHLLLITGILDIFHTHKVVK